MRLSADRLTAARMLMRVEKGAFSSRLLSGGGAPAARVRVLEVLRTLRALDTLLRPYCRRELRKLDAEVRAALRIGVAEVVRLGMPPALATDGAVRLVRRMGRSSASGLVNAVLRRATADWRAVLAKTPIDVQLSHPEWLHRRWVAHFGAEAAEAAMAAAQQPAATWIWFLEDSARSRLADEGVALASHPWCPDAWSASEDVRRLIETVSGGAAYAQDPSSQLVARVARALASEGDRFIDLCAAPGGKSALMLCLGGWGRAVAADIRLKRTRLMRPVVERAGDCAVITADAAAAPFEAGAWGLVLLDAPCTGTGTLRRHPELKWRLRPEAIGELADTQRDLLAHAVELVAPGGMLLFSTCSVEPEENEEVVADLPDGIEIENIESYLPAGVPWIPTKAGGICILPNPDGDGFTMHAVRRVV